MALRDVIKENGRFQHLRESVSILSPGGHISVTGLSGSLGAAVVAVLQVELQRPLLFILPDRRLAEMVRDDAQLILDPASLGSFVGNTQGNDSSYTHRATALHSLVTGTASLVVTHTLALLDMLPDPAILRDETLRVKSGAECPLDDLVRSLERLGFERKDFVEGVGDYSVRGGILDVFASSGETPFRLEFFGDKVESIREFDPTSQRSIRSLDEAAIPPHVVPRQNPDDLPSSLLSYLPSNSIIAFGDYPSIRQQLHDYAGQHPEAREIIARAENQLAGFPQVWIEPHGEHSVESIDFNSKPQPSFNGSVAVLRSNIRVLQKQGVSVSILCDAQSELKRLKELLDEKETMGREGTEVDGLEKPIDVERVDFFVHSLHEGFVLSESQFVLYTEHQIFNRLKRRGRRVKQRVNGFSRKELHLLTRGDFVVHADYGVGKFDGLKKIRVRDIEQEVVKLLYDQNDTLYVNLNYINRIQKYSSKEGYLPRLTRLGSVEWDHLKARAKKRIKDIARDLIRLYARRKQSTGFAFAPDTTWQKELEASFLYEDTFDQARTTLEVKADMEAPHPMDRLVCGDVGFGKTEIAVRAVFKSIMSGKQSAVLVPTTILAVQHHNTFVDRLSRYSTKIAVLSRFKSKKEQSVLLEELHAGTIDVVIGTHRLLSKDVQFKDLGLLVIDEEHRFGVSAKEKLRHLKAEVDTLTLTATPIPRTLQFSLMGSRDLSIIATPPRNRLPIITEIREYNDDVIVEAIQREVQRGGQVYFVHDRIQRIEEVTGHLRQLLAGVRIRYAHGQMHAHQLEEVMLDFMERKVDVLVCTKIIESGLDVPNVNTIIINRADRFGMAELYQLRGRVGRSNIQAYAYLLAPPLSVLPRRTIQRLQAVEEFVELGSGFNLAMRDLEIRGAGNLLGGEQSGFIETMGFETYTRVLEEAIQELKQDEFAELFAGQSRSPGTTDTAIELDVAALIPDDYIQNDTQRLEVYRQLYALQTLEQLDEVALELKDRFGNLPAEAENLIRAIRLKLNASRVGLRKVRFDTDELVIEFPPPDQKEFYESGKFQVIMARIPAMKGKAHLKQEGDVLRLRVVFPTAQARGDTMSLAEHYFKTIFGNIHDNEVDPATT
jgi:transcription-repair coupling factor (superfamily II helicase)